MARTSTTVLPLLEGLTYCRAPSLILKEGLTRWEAFQTIRRAVRRWVSSPTRPPPRKRRRRQVNHREPSTSSSSSSSSSSSALISSHWLWIILWESSIASERKAAAQLVFKALEELTTAGDPWFWRFRVARVFCEFHRQRSSKDTTLIYPLRDNRRTLEGIVAFFELLYAKPPTALLPSDDEQTRTEEVPAAAFLLACNRSLGILPLWSAAVWETSSSPSAANTDLLTGEALRRAGQVSLWNALFQWFVQIDRPSDIVWLKKLRRELWKPAPIGASEQTWTPLAYLIAAKVRTETSPFGSSQANQLSSSSTSAARRPQLSSFSISTAPAPTSIKGTGVPMNLLSIVTDPFHGSIRLMETKNVPEPSPAVEASTKTATGAGEHLNEENPNFSDYEDLHEMEEEQGNEDDHMLRTGDHHHPERPVGEEENKEEQMEITREDHTHAEDDEDEDDEDDEEIDDEDDEEIDDDEAMEIEMDEYTEHMSPSQTTHTFSSGGGRNTTTTSLPSADDEKDLLDSSPERRKAYLLASLQIVASQYPALPSPIRRKDIVSPQAENSLWEGMIRVILPPKPPAPSIKMILRRAPTQEEFFRGNLSTNPVDLDLLRRSSSNAAAQSDGTYEPTVGDLRQHIANDLQMGDSAELIEILIANKIVSIDLKLRVIHQVVWRQHLLENSTTSRDGGQSFVSMGSGISMIFSSGRPGRGHQAITVDTPSSQLPPMIAVYRLAGVDGEATEDTVDEVVDPEAPDANASAEARESQMEKEFGLTRLVAEGRGFYVLLRSIQFTVENELRRIRRDHINLGSGEINLARESFQRSPPCHGLVLLRHCAKLASNRKKLLRARAPTVLLTLLLEVLKALSVAGSDSNSNNPTADILQELIESLTTDISIATSSPSDEVDDGFSLLEAQDASSMPLLLESIEKISLKANLRGVISKLLPFLTYGQADLSRSLAQHFTEHIEVGELAKCEDENTGSDSLVMMKTFVETLIGLPASGVCNALRAELIHCSFIDKIAHFALRAIPCQPPSWSPALWTKKEIEMISQSGAKKKALDDAWRSFFDRRGVRTAIQILIGLCKKHKSTQARVAMFGSFVQSLHWIEATSDHAILEVQTNGLGLLAETLLDEMADENSEVARLIEGVRKKTKLRKRELAQERRAKTLGNMSSYGPLAGGDVPSFQSGSTSSGSSVRGTAASLLGSVVDFFGSTGVSKGATTSVTNTRSAKAQKEKSKKAPAWMAEMESMEEETGITCAICQEGRKLQPGEVLGLYGYVTKVAIPLERCGARSSLDGSTLLKSLPTTLPISLTGKNQVKEWFSVGKAASADHNITSSYCSTVGGKRCSLFTTTVSAGNAIHISCHRKAKQVDRNHPKAPKSEWEGAKLRNGRVDCNIILPLVSSHSSKVPLIAVDSALSEHQQAVSNILGTNAKSSLWTTLFDARFLLLRFAYGEALNMDCGGGSLASNCSLLFHHLTMGEMFEKNAQLEQPELSQHVRGLSAAFLAATCMVTDPSSTISDGNRSSLTRGIADCAPMAALTCILLHNQRDDSDQSEEELHDRPHPRRRWVTGREYFLKGLIICAGRRKALGIEGSGCLSTRNTGKRLRSTAFADWDAEAVQSTNNHSSQGRSVEDFQNVLRPMLTLYAIFETVSAEYHAQMDDVQIQEASERLLQVLEQCLRCKNIHELMDSAKVNLKGDELVELLQRGTLVA